VPPAIGENTARLLDQANSYPITDPEGTRLCKALEALYSTEWQRIILRLEPNEVAQLQNAAAFSDKGSRSLEELTEIARRVATMYGFETLGPGHLAIALAVTAELDNPAVEAVAEAFEFGHLREVGAFRDKYFRQGNHGESESAHWTEPEVVLTPWAAVVRTVAPFLDFALRLAACLFVCRIASLEGRPWGILVAVAVLPTSHDPFVGAFPRKRKGGPAERWLGYYSAWWDFPMRWPWLGVPAVAAAVFLGPLAASAIAFEFILLALIRASCRRAFARGVMVVNAPLRPLGRAAMIAIGIPDRIAAARQFYDFTFTLVGLVVCVHLSPALTPTLFFVYCFAVARGWLPLAASFIVIGALVPQSVPVLIAVGALGGAVSVVRTRLLAIDPSGPPGGPWFALVWNWHSAVRILKAQRLLRGGMPHAAAMTICPPGMKTTGNEELLSSFAWLEADEPGRARHHLSRSAKQGSRLGQLVAFMIETELITARGDASDTERPQLPNLQGPGVSLRWWGSVALARRLTVISAEGMNVDSTSKLILETIGRSTDPGRTALLLRLAAEACTNSLPWSAAFLALVADELLERATVVARNTDFALATPLRPLVLEQARSGRALGEAFNRLQENSSNHEKISELDLALWLLECGRPLEGARALNRVADRTEGTVLDHKATAPDARLEAIGILNSVRHRFEDPLDRWRWWQELGVTFAAAMREAVKRKDWRTLAELIESARLQLDEDATAVAHTAPFVSVRGKSALAETSWYDPTTVPPVYSLEDGATWAGGTVAAWWSSWVAEGKLYWAVVPPHGSVSGGTFDLSGTSLGTALTDLRQHLPIPLPGEDLDDVEYRMFASPLEQGPYDDERRFMERLSVLVPEPVISFLCAERNAVLVLAPDPSLAAVPWAALVLPGQRGDTRLIERADLVLAPPLSLIAAISRRPDTDRDLPVSLAVANPGGDLAGAQDLNEVLSEATAGNPAPGSWTTRHLASRLRQIPHASTAVFACHTHQRDGDSTPTGRGLLLSPTPPKNEGDDARPAPPQQIVTAGDLMEQGTDYPMPEQVILLACDSADLGQAQAGEWLVLGPAALVAGAQRALVTTYPMRDIGALDQPLINALNQPDSTLSGALTMLQRTHLQRWRTGDTTAAPVHWAGHALIGNIAPSRIALIPHQLASLKPEVELAEILDRADRLAHGKGRSQADWWDLAAALLGEGEISDTFREIVISLLLSVPRRRFRPPHPPDPSHTSPEVLELIQQARRISTIARHKAVDTNHLIVAILQSPDLKGAILRRLTRFDTRRPEVARLFLQRSADER